MGNAIIWSTSTEYYNEEGIQISKKDAKKNYITRNKIKKVKINGTIGTITYWHECERDKQLTIW